MSLFEVINHQVKDPRRPQGRRISLPQAFTIIIISHLCGYYSGRKIAAFGEKNEDIFTDLLELKHGVPSHVIFTDIMNRVDQKELINAFNTWTSTYVPLEKGDMVSGDGKVLGSTVEYACTKHQTFQAVVSLFCQKSGLIQSLQTYEQKKDNEISVIKFLVQALQNMGLVFF